MTIRLHIERLVLDGLPVRGSQGALVQAALEAELTRLLGEGGLAQGLVAGGAVPALAGAMQLGSQGDPAGLGAQVARAVYDGIGAPAVGGSGGRDS